MKHLNGSVVEKLTELIASSKDPSYIRGVNDAKELIEAVMQSPSIHDVYALLNETKKFYKEDERIKHIKDIRDELTRKYLYIHPELLSLAFLNRATKYVWGLTCIHGSKFEDCMLCQAEY